MFKEGDILCYRSGWIWNKPITYLAFIIRIFTRCKYNHSAIVVKDGGEWFINEAIGNGIVSRPLEKYLNRPKSSYVVLRPYTPVVGISARAMSKVGCKYDLPTLLFFQVLYRLTGIWLGRTTNADKMMVCSEYAAWCYSLYKWWLASTKEILTSDKFYKVGEK